MAEMAKGKAEKEVADVPLRLALIGAPFSGKTTMARKLAEECGCKVTSCRNVAAMTLAGGCRDAGRGRGLFGKGGFKHRNLAA